MKLNDCLGFGLLIGFGLWWLIFPKSVVGFYSWFHRGGVRMPNSTGFRLVGALWIILIVIVMLASFGKR
ncbi:MAG: hypothetical protein DME23_22035 [Verrucomicrobia bacterium]|nr:MAG: hypothetical protein DME23_22035 [Verrucomicrobiota bacterium]